MLVVCVCPITNEVFPLRVRKLKYKSLVQLIPVYPVKMAAFWVPSSLWICYAINSLIITHNIWNKEALGAPFTPDSEIEI